MPDVQMYQISSKYIRFDQSNSQINIDILHTEWTIILEYTCIY